MNRLHSELHRLYDLDANGAAAVRHGKDGATVRAMVLELRHPGDWQTLATVWQGVQADLQLPPPAIAVNGADGFQLWFSFAQAVPVVQATALVQALSARYLSGVQPDLLQTWPDASARAWPAPPHQQSADQWAAFVAPDLAPVFSQTPWLDIEPGPDGQADLLCRLGRIDPNDIAPALIQLAPPAATATAIAGAEAAPPPSAGSATGASADPKRFLLNVMNNEAVALNLRIEAAKALLPYCEPRRP